MPADTNGFEAEFARAVNRRDLSANFLLSMREDGLSKLDRFQGRIPTLMNNMLRLEHLDRDGAKEAITKPLDEYNRRLPNGQGPVTIEPNLVEAILDDLKGAPTASEQIGQGTVTKATSDNSSTPIETPFLQMVLTRLWDEERAAGSHVLRLQTFEALGRAENIARTHLDTIMGRLTDSERNDAANILRYLVTPSGTKIAQEAGALASWTELTEAQVKEILTRLSGPDMRILRTVPTPGQPEQYEIFHDVLAEAILDWRARYVEEQKRQKQVAIERAKTAEQLARQRARAKRFGLIAVGLFLVTVAMIYAAVSNYLAKFTARSLKLSAYSESMLSADPQLSLLLAIKAVEARKTPKAVKALKAALVQSNVIFAVGTSTKGGNKRIAGVAFSPDGQYIATASWDHTASVWDAKTGKSVSLLSGHQGQVNSVAFSPGPDGTYLVTAGADKMARVWEGWQTATPKVVKIISENDQIMTAAFSPDGKYILTGGGEGKVRVWDWRSDPPSKKAELARALAAATPQPETNSAPPLETSATVPPTRPQFYCVSRCDAECESSSDGAASSYLQSSFQSGR